MTRRDETLRNAPIVLIYAAGWLLYRLLYGAVPLLLLRFALGLSWQWSLLGGLIGSFVIEGQWERWQDHRDRLRHEQLAKEDERDG